MNYISVGIIAQGRVYTSPGTIQDIDMTQNQFRSSHVRVDSQITRVTNLGKKRPSPENMI